MSKWSDFYEDRVNSTYQSYFEERYKPFLECILEHLPDYFFGIGEFGCGIGSTSKYLLKNCPHSHYLYDLDEDILNLARENISVQAPDVLFHRHDITNKIEPKVYDLIHSHGVLEHFSDINIKNIIYHQLESTDVCIHYVPTDGYDEPSFGDERLKSVEWWVDLLSDFNIETKLFNDDKDLILICK